jgi:pseudouridine synthase
MQTEKQEELALTQRINKAMADRGLATRRGADELIQGGFVFVNGKRAELGDRVGMDDIIEVRDEAGVHTADYQYVAFYKPKGIVSHSASGKQRSIEHVSGYPELFPVGRLDKESEGLMVLTNDGRVTERLLHPRFEHEKEYFVEFSGRFPKNGEAKLREGILDNKELLSALEVELIDRKHLKITLTEGKKHQVRRMLKAIGLEVILLQRTRIMKLQLGALRPGASRRLTGAARKGFLHDLGL